MIFFFFWFCFVFFSPPPPNYSISILISKVSLYFNPEANYLWVRNSSQVLIQKKTDLFPPLV